MMASVWYGRVRVTRHQPITPVTSKHYHYTTVPPHSTTPSNDAKEHENMRRQGGRECEDMRVGMNAGAKVRRISFLIFNFCFY